MLSLEQWPSLGRLAYLNFKNVILTPTYYQAPKHKAQWCRQACQALECYLGPGSVPVVFGGVVGGDLDGHLGHRVLLAGAAASVATCAPCLHGLHGPLGGGEEGLGAAPGADWIKSYEEADSFLSFFFFVAQVLIRLSFDRL